MSEHTPKKPQPPPGQYPQPPGQYPPPPGGQYPPGQPPEAPPQYGPPGQPPPGQPPPYMPPGQPPPYGPPPGQPPGQYPPPPGGQYPPGQPPETPPQYPPPQPPGQPPPYGPPGQPPPYGPPPGQPPGQYPPPPGGQYPPGQPPGQPPQYGPPPGTPGQYPPGTPGPYPGQPPPGYGQPPKPGCPEPCDEDPPWGPPDIRPECCPETRTCCPDDQPCTWDEVDDPCVRASSAACGTKWTKLSCTCESSNAECNCDEWECEGIDGCVPCKPCEGLIPEDGSDGGGCDDPGDGCTSDALRRQLEALKRCISAQQSERVKLDAEIKAIQDREKELVALVSAFDGIVTKYKAEHHKLVSRENALKGFARDTAEVFKDQARFPAACLQDLESAINAELCQLERAKCCKKNLEGKLERVTRLIRERQEAEQAWKAADDAFKAIKDFPKYVGDQFAQLEALKDQIAQALNDKDPQKHKWAFYLFYWRFLPALCRRFKVAVCCVPKADSGQRQQSAPAPGVHIGCKPGDWHPSLVDAETLQKLICCAWDSVREAKKAFQEASDAVEAVKHNLDFITKLVDDGTKTLEDRIKARIEKVVCSAGTAR